MQRNIILFVILSAAILGAWFWSMNASNTDPDKKLAQVGKDKDKEKPQEKPKEPDPKPKDPDVKEKKEEEPKKPPVKVEPKKEPAVKEVPSQSETLGGDGFHLTVTTTTRGAGVRKVILNHFKSANWRGEPTVDKDGNPVPLELIQDDDHAPSFRMYHYLQPKDDNPAFGLGQSLWTFDGKKKLADDVHEVRYFTTLPESDKIKIVKTYRLAPKDYHVTLVLEVHDTRGAKDADQAVIPFRYQLTGGQGLPIEGEYYTAILRNAVIGMVDPRGSLWRKLEDSARISLHRGGDRFPEGSRGDSRLQYAGVANQYFASMLVVDDQQPKKDDGGVDADKVLAWARPTLETQEIRGIITKIFKDDGAILFTDFSDSKRSTTARYLLLPRTKKHLEDLELNEGDKAVLSYYETDDGKRRVASWVRLGETPKPQFDDITVRVNSEVIELSPGVIRKHQFMLYHGPVKAALLGQFADEKEVPSELVDRYTHTLHLNTLTDYRSDNPFGWVSSKIFLTDLIILFTRLMHWLLNILHNLISWIPGSYGLSIVILTVMVRGCMFPISRKQAMFSIKMQELAPELKKLQEKYPDDPAAKMQAQQEFYRKHGINPLGSCWPVFLQMPIFLGLYFALQESIHFRLAPFLWIENLAAPDMLEYWSESIPIISVPDSGSGILGVLYLGPYLNILPMIAVVFMMIQQMQTMPPPTDDQQAMQQKMLKFMSIFFGIMFYKVAAGLCIYFIASSLWGMAERKLLPKKKPAAEFAGYAAGHAAGTPPGGSPPAGGTGIAPGSPLKGPPPKGKGKWDKKDKNKGANKEKEAITTIDKIKALWRDILKSAEKK